MFDVIINNLVPFIVILTILVFVHELGHYLVARINGVKVEVFSIGFGKELFGITDKTGTRWKFSLIPLGGYVKMHGDMDAASTKKNQKDVNKKETFYNKSLSQRSYILFAGPAANFIFSLLVLIFMNMYYGYSIQKPIISEVENDSPAFSSGLMVNDIILSVNNNEITDLISLKKEISKFNNSEVNIRFSRNNKIEDTTLIVKDNRIGIRGTVETKKLNFVSSCYVSVKQIAYFVNATLKGIFEMITGSRGTEDLGGPIRIAELSGDFWSKGLESTLWFMMIISLNLGLINLFPIPMLDGGHLLLNLVEFINGGPLKPKFLEIVHTFGFVLLIGLMIFATYNDITRFIS